MLLLTTYENNSRQLKKNIIMLLKKKLATNIKRINYVKSYNLDSEWKISQEEEKLLLIKYEKDTEQELIEMLNKFNFNNISYLEEFNI